MLNAKNNILKDKTESVYMDTNYETRDIWAEQKVLHNSDGLTCTIIGSFNHKIQNVLEKESCIYMNQ